MKIKIWIILCGLVSYGLIALPGLKAKEYNPHEIKLNEMDHHCQKCHANIDRTLQVPGQNKQPMIFKQDEIGMCIDCHTDDTGSHIVDITVDFTVPADLPLSSDGKMTCLTCHRVHGRLHSHRSWASCNFMDHLLNSDRLTKTYLLRRNNANGELCLACHDPEENHDHE